ncbi:hypothetical protein [Streptomyces sp. NPDC002722]|uniref:hypothetical protein n=1 Tax=Streptomyces sp. NPDC002722 TaxID=3154425 RepID=UPI00332F93BE
MELVDEDRIPSLERYACGFFDTRYRDLLQQLLQHARIVGANPGMGWRNGVGRKYPQKPPTEELADDPAPHHPA